MSKAVLNESWKDWLKINLDKGCNPVDLMTTLYEKGFSLFAIREDMGDAFPAEKADELGYKDQDDDLDYTAYAEVRLAQPDNGLNAVRFDSEQLQLYTLDNCLTDEECERIIEISNLHLKPSTITTKDEKDKEFRTSETASLTASDDPFIHEIDEKIARILGMNLSYSEPIQAQKYSVGQQFKAHTDYFGPETFSKYDGGKGNRTWTFMIYLNDVPAGGGTKFTQLDHVFYPKKGMAVIWNNLLPDGRTNIETKHWGMPVEDGEKYIITKWFREKGKGPIQYED